MINILPRPRSQGRGFLEYILVWLIRKSDSKTILLPTDKQHRNKQGKLGQQRLPETRQSK